MGVYCTKCVWSSTYIGVFNLRLHSATFQINSRKARVPYRKLGTAIHVHRKERKGEGVSEGEREQRRYM